MYSLVTGIPRGTYPGGLIPPCTAVRWPRTIVTFQRPLIRTGDVISRNCSNTGDVGECLKVCIGP